MRRLLCAALYLVPLPALVSLQSCREATGPEPAVALEFVPPVVVLDGVKDTVVQLRNTGTVVVGPIEVSKGALVDSAGTEFAASPLLISPSQILTLDSGSAQSISISVDASAIQVGSYQVGLEAHTAEGTLALLDIRFLIEPPPPPPTVSITSGPTTVRQGDVVRYTAEARDGIGNVIGTISWSVTPSNAGSITGDGRLVGFVPGSASIIARASTAASTATDTLAVTITPRGFSGRFTVVGRGDVTTRFTSDIWVHGDVAYTTTWGSRTVNSVTTSGNTLYVWDISDPANPALSDSVAVDAGTVNDVKIRADGTLGVITHAGSTDGLNGITLLDLADPRHPTIIRRFTGSLGGVHNVWVDGSYVYAVGSGQLVIIDISDPSQPQEVALFSAPHDVYVRNGLAFLSHWDAGLVILDVGNGMAGGSPTSPVEVGRAQTEGGNTHNAWYWPDSGYVFVGEESGRPGVMHVVDVSDLTNPVEVATFAVPGDTPHNFWLDETRGILYMAWYSQGIRALDVTGELLGALDRQGREIASIDYAAPAVGCFSGSAAMGTCTWAPQLHNGLIYLSDMNTGMWVLQPNM